MAKLSSHDLTLEIEFREIDVHWWLQYDIWLRWQGEPLINPAILKQFNEYWQDRRDHSFRVNDGGRDHLLPMLRNFLETYAHSTWAPIEPDFAIELSAIIADEYVYEDDRHQNLPPEAVEYGADGQLLRLDRAYMRPDDYIEVKATVDGYQLRTEVSYGRARISVEFWVRRHQLETFYDELRVAYDDLLQRTPPKWRPGNEDE